MVSCAAGAGHHNSGHRATPAGSLGWPTAYRDGAATLITIQVQPAYRRRGYGRILLGVFAEQATAAGCRLLHLTVHKNNPAASCTKGPAISLRAATAITLYDTDVSTRPV
jgi:ribosomal protein S18 acetylase RimI-like enzyme